MSIKEEFNEFLGRNGVHEDYYYYYNKDLKQGGCKVTYKEPLIKDPFKFISAAFVWHYTDDADNWSYLNKKWRMRITKCQN